jgi:hypothetical protein
MKIKVSFKKKKPLKPRFERLLKTLIRSEPTNSRGGI